MAAEKFLRLGEVCDRTALSKSTIYDKIADETFPKSFPISAGRVAWREADIAAWQQARLKEAGLIEVAA